MFEQEVTHKSKIYMVPFKLSIYLFTLNLYLHDYLCHESPVTAMEQEVLIRVTNSSPYKASLKIHAFKTTKWRRRTPEECKCCIKFCQGVSCVLGCCHNHWYMVR